MSYLRIVACLIPIIFITGCGQKEASNFYYLNQIAKTKFFEITVNEVLEAKVINSNGLDRLEAQPGSKFILLNITIKNISSEARIFDSGELNAIVDGRELKYDKSEIIFAKGFINFGNINPLMSETGYVVFNIPETFNESNKLSWTPPRSKDKIYLSTSPYEKNSNNTELVRNNITNAVKKLVMEYRKSGILGASKLVSNCYDEYEKSSKSSLKEFRKYEYCISQDLAGYRINDDMTKALRYPSFEYFDLENIAARVEKYNNWPFMEKRIEEMLLIIDQDTRIALQEIQ